MCQFIMCHILSENALSSLQISGDGRVTLSLGTRRRHHHLRRRRGYHATSRWPLRRRRLHHQWVLLTRLCCYFHNGSTFDNSGCGITSRTLVGLTLISVVPSSNPLFSLRRNVKSESTPTNIRDVMPHPVFRRLMKLAPWVPWLVEQERMLNGRVFQNGEADGGDGIGGAGFGEEELLPLPENTLTRNLGLDLIVVVTKVNDQAHFRCISPDERVHCAGGLNYYDRKSSQYILTI